MKILYLAQIRFPTEKAHGWQIAKMCEGFVGSGASLELLTAKRLHNTVGNDPFMYYGVPATFSWHELSCIDLATRGIKLLGLSAFIQQLSFGLSALGAIRARRPDVVYTRDILVAWLASYVHARVVLELHTMPSQTWALAFLCRRLYRIIVITKALRDDLVQHGISNKTIMVSPDGVDLSLFKNVPDKITARKQLGLPLTSRLILYTGHLYEWKGVYTLAAASAFLAADVRVIVVGGTDLDSKKFNSFLQKHNLDRVTHIAHQPPQRIPLFLAAADVVVLPNSGKEKISNRYTSPLKLFEYMASDRPIVASALPSIMEILNNSNAVLVTADDADALGQGIMLALSDQVRAQAIARQAHHDVLAYDWFSRAKAIVQFVRS